MAILEGPWPDLELGECYLLVCRRRGADRPGVVRVKGRPHFVDVVREHHLRGLGRAGDRQHLALGVVAEDDPVFRGRREENVPIGLGLDHICAGIAHADANREGAGRNGGVGVDLQAARRRAGGQVTEGGHPVRIGEGHHVLVAGAAGPVLRCDEPVRRPLRTKPAKTCRELLAAAAGTHSSFQCSTSC
jgi:hypothetical protein